MLLTLAIALMQPAAPSATFADEFEAVITREGATVAARVIDLDTGEELYARNLDEPMIPASNLKLVTSAAALDAFGPDHTFDTHLYTDGQDLIVVGTGDPATGSPRIDVETPIFETFAKAAEAAGVNDVRRIVFDDHALPGPRRHPSWELGDLVYWYAAPVAGLNYNDNCLDFTLAPATPSEPAGMSVLPETARDFYTFVNLTKTVHEPENVGVSIERTQNANVFAAVGRVGEPFKDELPVTDPGVFFASVMQTDLETRGFTFAEPPARSDGPIDVAGLEKLATFGSPIRDVLRRVNSDSQNLFAEALAKLIGDEPTWEAGNLAAKGYLAEVGIDPTGLHLADGSGLSRDNRVTVRQLTEIMRLNAGDELWVGSMSIAGERGTLGRRMKGVSFRGKTGYISGVRALTGYLDAGDRHFIVSILYNDIDGSVRPYSDLQDEAVRLVLDHAREN